MDELLSAPEIIDPAGASVRYRDSTSTLKRPIACTGDLSFDLLEGVL